MVDLQVFVLNNGAEMTAEFTPRLDAVEAAPGTATDLSRRFPLALKRRFPYGHRPAVADTPAAAPANATP